MMERPEEGGGAEHFQKESLSLQVLVASFALFHVGALLPADWPFSCMGF